MFLNFFNFSENMFRGFPRQLDKAEVYNVMKKVFASLFLVTLTFFPGLPAVAQHLKAINKFPKPPGAPVVFFNVRAWSEGKGVWIEWEIARETNNLGFSVCKIVGGEKKIVNRGLISGAYLERGEGASAGKKYSFFDADGDLNSTYYIEGLHLNGDTYRSKTFSPGFVEDLTAAAGVSADLLKTAARTAAHTFVNEENILPADLKMEIQQAASQPDLIKQAWVAAQPGVKFAIKKEGLYRVTGAQLEAAGFDVSAPSALWQLYVNGIEQPIIAGNNPDFVEFYGSGIDTPEADAQTYYLVIGESNGKRIGTVKRPAVNEKILSKSYEQSVTKKERFIYSSSFLNGEAENFFGSVVNTTGSPVNFSLTGIDFSSPEATVAVGIQGLTNAAHQTLVTINNHQIGTVTGYSLNLSTNQFVIPTSFLIEGTNVLKVSSLNGSSDVSLFESIKVAYARKYEAQQNAVSFFTDNYKAAYVGKFTSPNIRVFDITNTEKTLLVSGLKIEQAEGSYRVFVPSKNRRVLFAVEDSAILAPASITRNKPSTLNTIDHNADLVIITYKDWAAQAEEWAAFRRAQNLSVEVVDIEDVYDEFNYGVLSAVSIRNFLSRAASAWNTPPKYALLIGDATYDPKNYTGNGNNNFIPTKLVDTVYTETGSDDALVDFNDDGLAEMAVGRLPVRNAETVIQLLNKVKSFEQTVAPGLTRGVLFASDLPNGYDFEGASSRLRDQLPQSVNTVMVNRAAADARPKLLAELNNGRFVVNFAGHGTTSAWVDSGFFSSADGPQLANANLSIFTMLTCLNGYFINPSQSATGDGLAEVILKAPNASVASWASTGLTTPDVQEIMATRFYGQLGAGNFARLGDLIRDSKTAINGGRDVRLSWVLLGDPTLKIK